MSKLDIQPSFRDTRGQDQQLRPTTQRRWLRPALILAIGIAAVVAAQPIWRWLSTGGQSVRADQLRFATVSRGDFIADVSGYAQVVAARAPTLFAAQAGTVQFQVDAGETVAKDQALAVIDSPELANRVAQERSTLASAQAEAAQAKIDNQRALLTKERARDEAKIQFIAAGREFERAELAFAKKAMSQVDHLRARDTVQATEIALKHADRDLTLERQSLALQLDNRLALVARQKLVVAELERQLEALTLRAPFAGVVGDRLQVDRAAVTANAPLLTLVDLGAFELDLSLSELYAQRLAPGLEASVERSGQNYPGTVKRVSPEVSGGQIRVRVAFADDTPADLKQNQRVLVRVELDRRQDVLTVERGGFLDALGGNFIWVRNGDVLQRRPIELGLIGADRVEVLSGLDAGQTVVLSAFDADADAKELYLH